MMKKEDWALKESIFKLDPVKPLNEDLLTLLITIVGAYSELLNNITDVFLLKVIYETGLQYKEKDSYKFATVYIFMCLTSVYLIAYSSMINMLLYKGVFEPA